MVAVLHQCWETANTWAKLGECLQREGVCVCFCAQAHCTHTGRRLSFTLMFPFPEIREQRNAFLSSVHSESDCSDWQQLVLLTLQLKQHHEGLSRSRVKGENSAGGPGIDISTAL